MDCSGRTRASFILTVADGHCGLEQSEAGIVTLPSFRGSFVTSHNSDNDRGVVVRNLSVLVWRNPARRTHGNSTNL